MLAIAVNRRNVLSLAAGAVVAGRALARAQSGSGPVLAQRTVTFDPALPTGLSDEAKLEALPGKAPLIKLSYRPPNYETPLPVFRDVITPNDAFFVRYHLADIPRVDAAKWRLVIDGDGTTRQFEINLDQLKGDYQPVEITAVCQCSGNRRGLALPHVPGVQWGVGAMGNARWKGARLKDILAKAGLKDEAIEVALEGADGPAFDKTPDFVKSLPMWKALDPDTIVAYEMNSARLPHFNGFPARIVAPGWTATYWMKHVTRLEPRLKPLDNFWMKSAYRVPARLFPSAQRFISQEAPANTPITEIMVNSLITSDVRGMNTSGGVIVKGIAWDGGYGMVGVDVSVDGAKTWKSAELGEDLGRYSFRSWQAPLGNLQRGQVQVLAQGDQCHRPEPAHDGNRQPSGLPPQRRGRADDRHHLGSVGGDRASDMRQTVWAIVLVAAFAQSGTVRGDELEIALKDAPGRDQVLNNCGACHSLDYIEMNSPFMDRAAWEAEVTKMIKAFGAPVDDADAKVITAYLVANYGK